MHHANNSTVKSFLRYGCTKLLERMKHEIYTRLHKLRKIVKGICEAARNVYHCYVILENMSEAKEF